MYWCTGNIPRNITTEEQTEYWVETSTGGGCAHVHVLHRLFGEGTQENCCQWPLLESDTGSGGGVGVDTSYSLKYLFYHVHSGEETSG